MSLDLMNAVWPMDLPHVQKFTLLALADRADDKDGRCYPSVRWIMQRTGLSERTVQRALVWLSENGHLTIKEQNGQSSNYVVHPRQPDTPILYESPPSESHPRQTAAPPPSERRGTPVSVTPDPRQPDTQSSLLLLNDPSGILKKRAPKKRERKEAPPEFDILRSLYPDRAGDQGWPQALKACNARLKEGATWSQMIDGSRRYREYCEATQSFGTQFVKSAQVFFGTQAHFKKPWSLPPTRGQQRQDRNISASLQWLAEQEANDASH